MRFRPAFLAIPRLSCRRFGSTPTCGAFLRYINPKTMAAAPTSAAPIKQLFAADGPLVWVDCEMTGLDLGKDKLLEIAVRECASFTLCRH